jgi:hypothetical protein
VAKRREYRRWLSVLAWFLHNIQWIVVSGVAKGISIGFGDKKQPEYLTPKQFFDMAPRFDATMEEESDDGR